MFTSFQTANLNLSLKGLANAEIKVIYTCIVPGMQVTTDRLWQIIPENIRCPLALENNRHSSQE